MESRPRPGPPALSDPSGERRIFGDGGFAPLGALLRRVAGVSRLYWCNSPVWRRPRRGPSSTVHLSQHNSPCLVAVRSRFGAAWRPKCRPPRRKTLTMGCRGRGGLRFGQNCLGHGVSLAHEPAIACANRLYRTSTRYSMSGRGCPRAHERAHVRMSGPRRGSEGPRAHERAQARGEERR